MHAKTERSEQISNTLLKISCIPSTKREKGLGVWADQQCTVKYFLYSIKNKNMDMKIPNSVNFTPSLIFKMGNFI